MVKYEPGEGGLQVLTRRGFLFGAARERIPEAGRREKEPVFGDSRKKKENIGWCCSGSIQLVPDNHPENSTRPRFPGGKCGALG